MELTGTFEPFMKMMQQMAMVEASDMFEEKMKLRKQKSELERLKVEQELKKVKGEEVEGEAPKKASKSQQITLDWADRLMKDPVSQKLFFSLDENQRQELIQAVSQLSMASSLDPEKAFPFMMLNALTKAQSGQSFTAKDLVEATKSQIDILKTGAELSGKRGESNTTELIKAVAELMKVQNGQSQTSITELHEKIIKPLIDKVDEVREEVRKERESRLQQQIETLRNSIRSPQDILKEFKETAETLGVQIGPGGGSSEEWRKEIERMKLEQDKWFKQQQLEMQRMQLEHSWEKEKWDSIIEGIWDPLLDKAEPIFHEAGKALGDRWRGRFGGTDQKAKVLEDKVKSNCPHCGYEFWVPKDNPPKRIVCTNCNHVLELEEPEKAGEG